MLESRSDPISAESFRRLHPNTIEDPKSIRSFLERARDSRVILQRGTNRTADPELARLREVGNDFLLLETENFALDSREQVFLNTVLDGQQYFFSAPFLEMAEKGELRLSFPAVVYEAERRDRARRVPAAAGKDGPRRVKIGRFEAEVADYSADGLSVTVPVGTPIAAGDGLLVRYLDGEREGLEVHADVRHAESGGRPGWKRIGLRVSPGPSTQELPVERREEILPRAAFQGVRGRWEVLRAGVRMASHRAFRHLGGGDTSVRVVEFENARGEPIRAIIDSWGDTRRAPAVVIPPAWGKTKETLLPLARTIVSTFRRSGKAVTVIRFDGIRRRGESYNDPDCRHPGQENLHYTFSQGVEDILATRDFLARTPQFDPSTFVLVSFSVSSIEARRAVALDKGARIGGWVSVVGAPDPQSLIRVISGGVDYLAGVERGIRFGRQDVQGLLLDIDRTGSDAVAEAIAFLSDAQRDMAAIRIPITWIHGRYDAWIEPERVRRMLSFGDVSQRRLIEVPIGHQLKSSKDALDTFKLIASEVARMALGRSLNPVSPNLADLAQRHEAERKRLPASPTNVRSFWRDYLVGRDGHLGMELVTSTRSYRDLAEMQVTALDLRPGETVVDLGSGVGSFPLHLLGQGCRTPLVIIQVDYVPEALKRARARIVGASAREGLRLAYVAADLEIRDPHPWVALADDSADALLASLLLNYVKHPQALLREMFRLLRPGGRFVISSLRRDADVSGICVDGIAELRSGLGRSALGEDGERRISSSLQAFISDAARLLDLEEQGFFKFWDAPELATMVRRAGFEQLKVQPAFGTPPQAFIVSARRPTQSRFGHDGGA